jgi:DNA polymerase-3 subunit gamma/tau
LALAVSDPHAIRQTLAPVIPAAQAVALASIPAPANARVPPPPKPATAIYSQSGALPPGQILPVRATQPWDEAPEAAPEDDYELVEAHAEPVPRAAVPAPPIDHRVVGVPVRQQVESRADASAAAQAAAVLIPTEEGAFWHATVQGLVDAQAIGAMVRELALQSQLVARDEDQWLLRVERESLNQACSRERLTAAVRAAGYPVDVVVEIGRVSDCPVRRSQAASQNRLDAARRLIESDPFVQRMVQEFGAKIVPGSIQPL